MVPELVSLLGSRLSKQSIVKLMTEPLRYLTHWIGQNRNPCHISEVAPMIEHCPLLTDLEIPLAKDLEDINKLTEHIVKKCPKLCRIMQGSTDIGNFSSFDYHRDGAMSTRMMNFMHKNTLAEFIFRQIQSPEDGIRLALQRHSESSTRIELTDCDMLLSQTQQKILTLCSALEEFVVSGGSHALYSNIPLYKTVQKPWASTRFRRLDLAIDIGEMEERLPPIYSRPAPIVLTKAEKERFELLELFYRQIGALVDLTDLTLRVTLDEDEMTADEVERQVDYHCFSFPGLLTLGNPKKGWPGYLHLLSGLKKLRRLVGSVNVVTDETKLTVGRREVVFLEQTFPKLEVAEFLSRHIQHPPCFQWLKKQCPRLQMSYAEKK
ncbi:hypothetical protein BGZ96_011017 [Linnemannia gamsii]|uniref:F-box domain-containing protein n=1 Tax=Linnemannia gamsii TaxID=64522 RepID=A0ABQ7KBX1_9FUNG|nr:hypothetical protein BGZ96_011017 [Linnemannia gamsii]